MDKIKFLAFIAVAAMFFACGSQDGSPPELKNGHSGSPVLISPFDTLVAMFDSKIVDIGEIRYSHPDWIEQTSSNILHFVGKYGTAEGNFKYFKPDEKDSIIFLDIKNSDDYIQHKAVFYYSTYPILDSPDNGESSPDDIIGSFGKTNLTRGGVAFAGVIGIDDYLTDRYDYFKLSIDAFDSLYIKLSNTRNNDAKLELIAPFKNGDTTITEISNFIKYEMNLRDFDDEIDRKTPVQFKIRVNSRGDVTPYLLTVKVVEFD